MIKKKYILLHTYNGILARKRNKFESVVVRWMNLEPVLQSKVNQKEKNKYHILMYIYGFQKNSNDEPVYREEMEMTHRE